MSINLFIDDSESNLDSVKGSNNITLHTPTHPKCEGEWLTTIKTFYFGNPDGLLSKLEYLSFIFNHIKSSSDIIWVDIDKCLDGWISLSRKQIYTPVQMIAAYQKQGLVKNSDLFKSERLKIIEFLSYLIDKCKIVFWTANNELNTIRRFRDFWEIPADILNRCGLVYGRKGTQDIPKKDLIQPYLDEQMPTIGDLNYIERIPY